jgi:hypothetical protein
VGISYSTTIMASGGTGPYTWSGTGVDGLTFSAAGVLSVTPSAAGTFTQRVTVSDSAGNAASASLALSVAPATVGSSLTFVQVNSVVPQGQNTQVAVPFIATQTAGDRNILEDEIVARAGSYSATATLNGGAWIMQMVAFRAAGSGMGAAPAISRW